MHHQTEFNKHTALQSKYGSNAYMLWVLGLYLDESDLDALAARSLTDGGNDKCIDFIEIDKTGQKIVVAQGYFSEKSADKAPAKKASDLTIAASWLAHGDENAQTLNEQVRARAIECRAALDGDEIEQIELLYIHNRPESLNSQEELDTCARTAQKLFEQYEIPVICKELGLREIETLYRERSSQILVNDAITIDGSHMGSHSTNDWDAHIYNVKGTWLRDLFKQHDDRLFSANYRGFLGISKRKKINSSIKSTAERQSAHVSRIDLFVDFQSSVDMESWDRNAWVTRASSINAYAVSGQFSGWSVGLGGIISARLYNKLLEIVVSGKDWILPLWQKAGWQASNMVWRLEFELKREVLTQKGISKLHQVLGNLNGLWSYATTEWLRLTLPSEDDKTRSRWPIHPLWGFLSAVDWEGKGGPLAKRFSPSRSPNDDKLFQIAYSAILSYMAKHGFPATELYEGAEDFLANAYAYHERKANDLGLPFDDFITERLALKHRQYNTAINDPEQEVKRKAKELAEQARAYCKESDGH